MASSSAAVKAAGASLTDDVSLLVIILDANPSSWLPTSSSSPNASHFTQFLQQLCIFINSFLLLHSRNKVAVIAYTADSASFLLPSLSSPSSPSASLSLTASAEALKASLEQLAAKEAGSRERKSGGVGRGAEEKNEKAGDRHYHHNGWSLLSGGLSLALTYISKQSKSPPPHPSSRILCLHASQDCPHQYVSIMNAIFSAQKLSVPIDACLLSSSDSSFLQQATFLTGGLYLRPKERDGILQHFLMLFAADLYSRESLRLPRPSGVDFRASCFCHKKTIDLGFVCSVCLSIICSQAAVCGTCGAEFSRKSSTK